MNTESQWLLDYASNTYSQTGEDGVIAKILSSLPETDGWCVEFGAWDGMHLSNVRRLVREENYRAILIEGDDRRFRSLRSNYAGNDKVQTVNAFVGFDADNGLDRILSSYSIPRSFDFLWNAFFVDEKYFAKFEIADNKPQVMRRDHFSITWFFSGFDGSVHLAGAKRMPWHGISIDERRTQVLPRILRSYPDNYTGFQKILFQFLKRLRLLSATGSGPNSGTVWTSKLL